MALPTTIKTGAIDLKAYSPPFISSGGNVYVALVDAVAGGDLHIYKATDPTSSFTIQDDSNRPTLVQTGGVGSVFQVSDVLHIITMEATPNEIHYHTFNMATDAWAIIDEVVETPTDPSTNSWISISARSDGDIIIVYGGDTDMVMGGKKERVDYARREGGTWTVGVAVDDAGDLHYGNPSIVKGPLTDDMHIMFTRQQDTADPPTIWDEIIGKTLDPSNTLSTAVVDSTQNVNLLALQNSVVWEDGSNQRIGGVFGTDSFDSVFFERAVEDGSDDISSLATTTISDGTNDGFVNGELCIATCAELDDEIHVLYSGGGGTGSDQDIYYVKSTNAVATTWSTPVEELDAVTCNSISANIYVRGSDTVLSYSYRDGTDLKYNEKVLIEGTLDISPTGITSAEAFGATNVQSDQTLTLTGIASVEAFGTALITLKLLPTGIATGEAFGTAVLTNIADISPASIASAEAFGATVVTTGAVDVSPAGIASAEAFGAAVVDLILFPTGIASAEAFGTTTVDLILFLTGIASAEAFGTTLIEVSGTQNLSPAGIISSEAFGTALFTIDIPVGSISSAEVFGTTVVTTGVVDISPTGISSGEVVPSPTVTKDLTVAPNAIVSAEAFGTTIVAGPITVPSISSAEAFGAHTVSPGVVDISPTGIASLEAFGNPDIDLILSIPSIASGEAFGTAAITSLAFITLAGNSIASAEAIGDLTLTTTNDIISTGISSGEAIGNLILISTNAISPAGIVSSEAFGTAVVALLQTVSPAGIVSAEAFGTANFKFDQTISLTGIASEEAFGLTDVNFFQAQQRVTWNLRFRETVWVLTRNPEPFFPDILVIANPTIKVK